ncbi:MAG: hypothetical protein E1N59_3183, partial [Puniceicoccaceae bacterium 5H]
MMVADSSSWYIAFCMLIVMLGLPFSIIAKHFIPILIRDKFGRLRNLKYFSNLIAIPERPPPLILAVTWILMLVIIQQLHKHSGHRSVGELASAYLRGGST